jgi:hypothetical protein
MYLCKEEPLAWISFGGSEAKSSSFFPRKTRHPRPEETETRIISNVFVRYLINDHKTIFNNDIFLCRRGAGQ